MNFKSLERQKSLTEVITEQLRDAIVKGTLQLGEALSEASLAVNFGVSKTPVREALFVLKQEGIVDILPQKGSFVFKPTEDEMNELCDYREILEVQAMLISVERHYNALLEDLEVYLVKMNRRLLSEDYDGFLQLDRGFHDIFLKYSDNRYLINSYELVNVKISALRRHLTKDKPVLERIYVDHVNILQSIQSKEIEKTAQLMKHHIMDVKQRFSLIAREL